MARKKTPLPLDVVEEIQRLAPLARKARRQHPETDAKVQASRALTALFCAQRDLGFSISQLAEAADMTYHSVSARIKSHA